MQDDSLNGRDNMLEELRESAKRNEQNLQGSVFYYRSTYPRHMEDTEEVPRKYSTFVLRLFLCVVVFGAFLWSHLDGQSVLGYNTEKVVEAISTDVDLQDIPNSVKINP